MPPPQPRDVLAAGAVVTRKGKQVLLVHRPTYDDWSFPKGKLDRGEHAAVAAVREVAEETGVHVRLGRPLSGQRYPNGSRRMKHVFYWAGWAVGDDDVSGYLVNQEIDEVVWVSFEKAMEMLTYPRDRETLVESRKRPKKTRPLVLLRHASARSRKSWRRRDDRLRPLLRSGELQSQRLVPLLAAYDVTRILSSSSTRCVQTLQPYADTTGWKLEDSDGLSEEDATPKAIVEIVDELLHAGEGSVLCTHRPVLPSVFDALGIDEIHLEPGGLLVVHHRKGKILATEHHSRP